MAEPSKQNQQLSAAATGEKQLTRTDYVKRELLSVQKQVSSLLMDDTRAKKFLAASMVVALDPGLEACSPNSIAQACVGVAMADLNVDKNFGHAYILPYSKKDKATGKWVKEAQLQIGAKGYKQLMFRAGWMCKDFAVYNCDTFEYSCDGWDNSINFIPNIDARNEGDQEWIYENLRGIYVVARHSDTGDEYSLFVNKSIIEKLRKVSPNQRANDYTKGDEKVRLDSGLPVGIWREWYEEMASAKAIKKLAKKLPMGDRRLQTLIAADDNVESGKSINIPASLEAEYIIENKEPKQARPVQSEQQPVQQKSEDDTIDAEYTQVPADEFDKELPPIDSYASEPPANARPEPQSRRTRQVID